MKLKSGCVEFDSIIRLFASQKSTFFGKEGKGKVQKLNLQKSMKKQYIYSSF